MKNTLLFIYSTNILVCLLTVNLKNFLTPKNPKMCDLILVTVLKMRPHYSQSSREVDYEQSLFFLGPSSKTPSHLAASPLNARARALPLLNLKKKRDCSQSSRENATPSSGTSPLASYKEVPGAPRDNMTSVLSLTLSIVVLFAWLMICVNNLLVVEGRGGCIPEKIRESKTELKFGFKTINLLSW